MLPSHLQSTYNLYKQDTSDIATWLVETARSLGHTITHNSDEFRELEHNPKTKNAGRKTKHTSAAARASTQERRAYLITIKAFSELATYISENQNGSIKVPLSILYKLQRTIDARRKCNIWHQANTNSRAKDESHFHFVNVLQSTFDLLKPHSTHSEDAEIANIFSHLDVEEPSETYQTPSTQHTKRAVSQSSAVQHQLHTPPDKSETFFAAFTLFDDIAQIYSFLVEMWQQYHQGLTDLVTVSITSNVAIDLVQRIEENFFNQFTQVTDPEELIEAIAASTAKAKGKKPASFIQFDESMQSVTQFTFGDMLVLLKSLMDVMSIKSLPICKPGFFGVYQPNLDRDRMNAKDRFDQEKLILGELLPEFWMLAQNSEPLAWEDGLTRGFRSMLKARKVTICSMFAARLFLDVHNLLRVDLAVPFQQLQALGKHMKESWALVIKMRDPSETNLWPRDNDRAIHAGLFKVIHEWLEQDAIGLRIQKLVAGRFPLPQGKSRLFRQHPLLCGLLAFHLHSDWHKAGVAYATALGYTLFTSHLYNAVQQEGCCSASWTDMDLMIQLQTEDRLFVGRRPHGTDDYFRRFCLCVGYSAEQFAPNRRQRGTVAASRGPRSLATEEGLTKLLHGHPQLHSTAYLESIDDFIESKFVGDDEAPQNTSEPRDIITVALRQRTKKEIKAYSRSHGARRAKLSHVQLLLGLKSIVATEIPRLAFDYFHLHRSCQQVLDAIQKKGHELFKKYLEPGYLETKSQLPFIVGYIFMIASNSQQAAAKLGLKKRAGVQVSSELLTFAGHTMETMLTERNFGPHCHEATTFIALDGRLMFSKRGTSADRAYSGVSVDFGDFEMLCPDDADQHIS